MPGALDKWAIFDHPSVAWKPNPGQLMVAENPCRHKVVAGGRRLGKDYLGSTDKLLPEVFYTKPMASTLLERGKKRIFWIVGPSYQESEKSFRVIWNWIRRLEIPMDKGSFNNPESGLMQIKLWGGAMEIIAKSAQVPERLVGEGLSGVVMCEAAKMKSHIWSKYIRPTLADFGGWSFFGSTPEGKNWFYDLWRHAQDPSNTEWASWRIPAWINYHVYKHPTVEADVMRCLELVRQTGQSPYALAETHGLTIDPEILNSIADLSPEAFLQEIASDFCADTDTEIFTQRGWLRYNEVVAGDFTLGMKIDGTVEWTPISRVNVFPAKPRKMMKMTVRGHDSLTTLDHRWLVERVDQNAVGVPGGRIKDRYFVTSENLGKVSERIVSARVVANLPETIKYTDALVELVAWYWTEGSLHSSGSGHIQISQSRDTNPEHWYKIHAALTTLFGPETPDHKDGNGWCVYAGKNTEFGVRKNYAQFITEHAPGKDKKLSYAFINSLTLAQLELFVRRSIDGDGTWHSNGGAVIGQKVKHNLDVLQYACQLLGLQTTLSYREPKTSTCRWYLSVFTKTNFFPKSAKRIEVDYNGKVWCPSTETSTWLARRNGTVYFTGNTEYVGRVFKEFDEEYHVTDLQFHPGWDTYACADFGFSNPNVWLLIQVGPWGEINVLDEIYESGLDPEDFADEIRYRGLNPPSLRYFFPDPADPLSTKILEKKLNIQARGGTGGELNNRINWIRKALRDPRIVVDEPLFDNDLKPGSTRPRLLFDRRCARTIQDMLNYRYPEKKSDSETSIRRYDLPMKRDDHGPEALGRFFAGMFGQYGKPATGVRVHRATFGGSVPNVGPKHERFTRRVEGETNRESFPKINDALGNYLSGAYDK